MAIFNGDDLTRINEFAEKHGKKWQIIDSIASGIRLKFKDGRAFVYNPSKGSFDSAGDWKWEDVESTEPEPDAEIESKEEPEGEPKE